MRRNKDDKMDRGFEMNFIYHGVQCLRFVSSSKVNNIKWFFEKSFFSRSFRRTHQTSRKFVPAAKKRCFSATSICVRNMCIQIPCNYNFYIYKEKKERIRMCA